MAEDRGSGAGSAGTSRGDGDGTGADLLTIEETARLALALPEVTEGLRWGRRTWLVHGTSFAWERPFSKADVKRFGTTRPPEGPIVGVRVADLAEKEAVLAAHPVGVFTIPHFDGYPAVLIALHQIAPTDLHDLLIEGWLACAPPKLAEQYLQRS